MTATDQTNKVNPEDGSEDQARRLRDELEKLREEFTVDTDRLKKITERFQEELGQDGFTKGRDVKNSAAVCDLVAYDYTHLESHGHIRPDIDQFTGLQDHGKNIAMYVTWVHGFPTGKEKGDFLTIDLGGTNLRICWISLRGNEEEIGIEQEQYTLPKEIKTAKADKLWSFIAESLQKFIEDQSLHDGDKSTPLNLGFTFSYPAIQDKIDHAVLQTWTKGFDITGVEGEDVASQLRNALEKLDLPVTLLAVVNDTTGAMIASAYHDPKTVIGAIFGTGCNAAYMDKISNIPKLKDTKLDPDTPMAINCEYGAFDNARSILPVTRYDSKIDSDSPRPGEQAFEKLSAGLYLGEIYRLIIADLHSRDLFLVNQDISTLSTPYSIDTAFLSKLEHDTSPSLTDSATLFTDSFNLTPTHDELSFSQETAHIITIRGARLCATGIAAICRRQGITRGHVAADGSVANKHPTFKERWGEALGEILGWEDSDRERGGKGDEGGGDDGQVGPIVMTSAEDGSGVGAAVIAAMTLERQRGGGKGNGKGEEGGSG